MDVFIYPTHPRLGRGNESCWFHKLLPPGPVIDTEVTHAVLRLANFIVSNLTLFVGSVVKIGSADLLACRSASRQSDHLRRRAAPIGCLGPW